MYTPKLDALIGAAFGLALLSCSSSTAADDKIGEVVTEWNAIGANHTIEVLAFDDPKVTGVTCYVSAAKTGGVKGSLGIAEDTSDASIACRQVAPIAVGSIDRSLKGELVFAETRSVFFKKLRVVRMWDAKRCVLTYLVYSDKLVEGSPKNSITAVPVGCAR